MPANRVVVVGTGTMGAGIAEVFALGNRTIVLVGRTDGSVASGLERARLAGDTMESLGLLPPDRAADAAERLSGSTDLAGAVREADLVVESIVENLEQKRACLRRIEAAAPADAILATNTSGLSITAIAAGAARPERIAGMHWWNPPHLIPLVEIVRGERTADATTVELAETARALGKLPVQVKRDVPGFIANRLQYALLREAVSMVAGGVASAEDIDLAMRAGPGLRYAALGPLEVADFIGLDVVAGVMDYLLADLEPASATPPLLADMVEAGKLGAKAGEGFYRYGGRPLATLLAERDTRLAKLPGIGLGAQR